MEAKGSAWISADASEAIKRTLETYGAFFFSDNDGMGDGVRLKFTRNDVKQLGQLENEGGPSRADDVP